MKTTSSALKIPRVPGDQAGSPTVIRKATEIIYQACRQAEENGWTVGQELGANENKKLIEPPYALLLDSAGKPTRLDASDEAQEAIARKLSTLLGVRITRARVDALCEGIDAGDWGHDLHDDPQADDSWFAAGWHLAKAMNEGRSPWWDGHKQRRVTAGWIVKIGDSYITHGPRAGHKGDCYGIATDASRVAVFEERIQAHLVAVDLGKPARVVRVVRRAR